MPTERDIREQLRALADTIEVPSHMQQSVQDGFQRYIQRRVPRAIRPMRVLMGTIGSLAVVGSGALVSGFASPRVAHALQQLPIIGGVADALYASDRPSVQRAVENGFNIPINQSITRGGITLTVTNAYFGPDQLWIGMTESFAKNLKTHPRIRLGKVKFQINGQTPPRTVEFRPMANGTYAGDVGVERVAVGGLPPSLPTTVTAKIGIQKIGDTVGNWNFTVHLSRKSADAATKTVAVNVSKHDGDVIWNVNRVTITPATVWMYGEVTLPGHQYPNFMIGPSTKGTGWMGAGPGNFKLVRHTATTSTWSFWASFDRPASLGSSVTIEPIFNAIDIHVPMPSVSKAFVNGAYTFLPATSDQMSITGITVDKSTFRVDYTSVGNQYAKNNFYNLALMNSKAGTNLERMEYPSGIRVVNRAKHEAELIFPRTGKWTNRTLSYYPPGLPTNPFQNRKGISAPGIGAPSLTLRVPLG